MNDLERELRSLRGDIRVTPRLLPAGSIRRIKARRVVTSAGILGLCAAVIAGGALAAGSLRRSTPSVEPARAPSAQPPVLLFSSHAGGHVTVSVQPDLGVVCFSGVVLDGAPARVEIVRIGSMRPVVVLHPSEDEVATPDQQGRCVGKVSRASLLAVAASPNRYALAIEESDGRTSTAGLSGLGSSGSPLGCEHVVFEATYLPPRWIGKLQAKSGAGSASSDVLGHFGSPAAPGSKRKLDSGYLDLLLLRSPPIVGSSTVEVMGNPARVVEGASGPWLEFEVAGCGYALLGIGVDRPMLVRFAEGLRPPDG